MCLRILWSHIDKKTRDEEVKIKDGDEWIQLNYQAHILPHIDWFSIKPTDLNVSAPDGARLRTATVNVGDAPPVFHEDQEHTLRKRLAYPISRSAFRTLCQIHGKWLGLQKHCARISRNIRSIE